MPNPSLRATPSPSVRVKGGSIRSKLAFVHETFGEQAERQMLRLLTESGVDIVLEASWYDYDLFDRVLRAISDLHFAGDVKGLRAVGRFSANFALHTTYQAFLNARDIHGFLNRLPRLHGRYYDQGRMRLERRGESHYEICLVGQPYYHQTDLEVAAGFYVGATDLMSSKESTCDVRTFPDRALFDLRWSI